MAGDAPDLHHRRGGGIGQHDGHLQEDAEEVADIVRRMFGEALGAVPALQQERLAGGDFGQVALQIARFTGENERRKAGELALDVGERRLVPIDRRLLDR